MFALLALACACSRSSGDSPKSVAVVEVSDMTHLGRAWVSFLEGGRADLPAEKREQVLAEIRRRWPDAHSVPVLPSGGEPLAEDLRLTSDGYKIVASAAPRHGLSPRLPLVVHD